MLKKALILLSFGVLVFSGCNVFEGLYEEGSSDDPDVLVADADLALQRGEPDKAVQYLQKALEKDPQNSVVRTKLSTSLLQANDINIISMIELAEILVPEEGGGKLGGASKTGLVACNFVGTPKEEIVLSNAPVYIELKNKYELLQQIDGLLQPVLGNPAALNLLSTQLKNTALLNDALVDFMLVIIDVELKRIELGASLWRLQNDDVGLCADDEAGLLEIQQFVKCEQIPKMLTALSQLRARIAAGSDSSALDVIDELDRSIDKLEAQIFVSCS